MVKVNPQKGEFPITVAGHDLVFVATLGNLASLSGMLGTQSQADLLQVIVGQEPRAMLAAVECLSRENGVKAAMALGKLPGRQGLGLCDEIADVATKAILFDPEPEPGEA